MKPTPHDEINQLLRSLSEGIAEIVKQKLVGLYLFGSLSYNDFRPESSDIDLVAILKESATTSEINSINKLHTQIEQQYPNWAKRVECSYTLQSMLLKTLPPKQPRPYYGEGIFYDGATYGNEWIINVYLLYHYGIPLVGPQFRSLVNFVDIKDVQLACIRDLYREWEPKLRDPEWLNNSHYQSYLILNLCRIVYTVMTASAASKTISANWVMMQFPEWKELIQTAASWHYGINMEQKEKACEFLKFVTEKIKKVE